MLNEINWKLYNIKKQLALFTQLNILHIAGQSILQNSSLHSSLHTDLNNLCLW